MAPAYKLTYFDGRGAGEAIRWLFKLGDIEFEEVRIKIEDWSKVKGSTPFGQLPYLEHKGKIVNQSVAICRYLGKLVKLAGNDDWENLEIDAVADTFIDLRTKLALVYWEKDETKKKELLANFEKETLPFYFSRFEKMIKENKGYLVLGRLTWADILVVSMGPYFDNLGNLLNNDKYPNLVALRKTVESLPAIKKWIEVRPDSFF